VLVVVLVVFGTGKLRTLGSDLGTAIKEFRKATREGSQEASSTIEALSHEERKASTDEGKQNV
jgi:sec-independent protein translocase protein TatA